MTTDNEKFEKWFDSKLLEALSNTDKLLLRSKLIYSGSWLAEFKDKEIAELTAQNEKLRGALLDAIGYIPAYAVNESVVVEWRNQLKELNK